MVLGVDRDRLCGPFGSSKIRQESHGETAGWRCEGLERVYGLVRERGSDLESGMSRDLDE